MKNDNYIVRPLICILLVVLLGGVLISINMGKVNSDTAMLLGGMCLTLAVVYALLRFFPLGDHYIFMITAMLGVIGVIMLLRLQTGHGQKQVIWFSVGAGLFLVTSLVYRFVKHWNKLNKLYVIGGVVLFLATALFGYSSGGAKSWLRLGGFSFQPSELVKILFILTLAGVFTNEYKKPKEGDLRIKAFYNTKLGRNCAATVVAYVFLLFLLLQRDWGTAVLFFAIYIAFMAVYGEDKRFLLLNGVAAILVSIVGVSFMSHIQIRVETWLRPFHDVSNKGYQITQSLFAIGEGGFTGRGIGAGSPYYIPEVHSDFIFSAICEETGILGGLAVIMLYFVLVYRAFKISLSTNNDFNKAVAMGIGVMIGVQTFIIIGGVIKFIPLTGITLPFVSYGGSSMVTTFLALGILQGISARRREIEDEI
ncbi:MAG: FtsW/RodA/SpoVE family cell cycle protein [Clostridia bacterium]|nr:FtsW/RodA/SpoVE family cell cycle protein [Clostridia bacterium]